MQREKIEGKRFGMLTVKEYVGNSQHRCVCDCGNTTIVCTSNLTRGHTTSCGCKTKQDITGNRYGLLTVIGPAGYRQRGIRNVSIWHCVCDCGNTVDVYMDSLKDGVTRSCGCITKNKDIPQAMRNTFVDGTQINKIQSVPTKANKSGVVGVNWDKARCKWQASIRFKGHKYALGRYDKFEDAVAARKAGERKYFGEMLDNIANSEKER